MLTAIDIRGDLVPSATTTRTRTHLRPRPAIQRPRAIAHRGASSIAPENTLLAYRLAIEFGADALEVDARLTRDGVIALSHDADLSRATDCARSIDEVSARELRSIDAGFWFCPPGRPSHPFRGLGISIPTLAELLEMLQQIDSCAQLVIEIKNAPDDATFDPTERLAGALVDLLREREAIERCCVSSFRVASIDRVKELEPRLATALLVGPDEDVCAAIACAADRGHAAVHLHESLLQPEECGRCVVDVTHRAGLAVEVWTVNERERMTELQRLGVDGIMSDDPERLCGVLDGARVLND